MGASPKCPKCGGPNVNMGYGLAGGGIGTYEMCEDCDYFQKWLDPEISTEDELKREKERKTHLERHK